MRSFKRLLRVVCVVLAVGLVLIFVLRAIVPSLLTFAMFICFFILMGEPRVKLAAFRLVGSLWLQLKQKLSR